MERKAIEKLIRQAYSETDTSSPYLEQIRNTVESLPKRYYDLIFGRIIQKKKWFKLEDELYYSERRMRSLLNDAIELLNETITASLPGGDTIG